MTMTVREIQFVRDQWGGDASDLSDADIVGRLRNTHYLARVRLTIAADDFVGAIKSRLFSLGNRILRIK